LILPSGHPEVQTTGAADMRKRQLFGTAPPSALAFVARLLCAILLPFAAAPALPQVPPRFLIRVALLPVRLAAEQGRQELPGDDPGPDWLRRREGNAGKTMGAPLAREATGLPALPSSPRSGGRASIPLRAAAVPPRAALSRCTASPVCPGDTYG